MTLFQIGGRAGVVCAGSDEFRAYSSAWLERFPDKEEVGGSSPPRPTKQDN